MIARLVESGRMKWSDTIGECFPDASDPRGLEAGHAQTTADRHSRRAGELPQWTCYANGLRSVPNAPKRVERRC